MTTRTRRSIGRLGVAIVLACFGCTSKPKPSALADQREKATTTTANVPDAAVAHLDLPMVEVQRGQPDGRFASTLSSATGAPRPLIGTRMVVAPIQARANGHYYYLVTEKDGAFQWLVEGPSTPGPTLAEDTIDLAGGTKGTRTHIGMGLGDRAGMGIEVTPLEEVPDDVNQALARRLESHAALFGFTFVSAQCTLRVGVPLCSAKVTGGPNVSRLLLAIYIPKPNLIVSYDVFAERDSDAVWIARDLVESTFKIDAAAQVPR